MVTRLFVDCGGTNPANGFYTNNILNEFYNEKNGFYFITYSNGFWNLSYQPEGSSAIVYYRLSAASDAIDPTNDTSWQVVNGTSPTIKSFNADDINTVDSSSNYVFGTIVVTGADITATNGTYTRTESGVWTHSNSLYRIASYSSGRYAIYNIGTSTAIYQCDSGGVNFHPVTIYDNFSLWSLIGGGGGTTPPTSSYYNTTTICSGGGGASATVMKILMKTVQVVVIANSAYDPKINGIYYLANPGNGYNSFFSKDGGDSYPRIIYDDAYNSDDPYIIRLTYDNTVYYGGGAYPQGWPGVGDFANANWYYDSSGSPADITSSTSTVNRPHVYKNGNIGYGRI